MGRAASWQEKIYNPQQALCLSSRLFVLLRDELGLGRQPKVARLLVDEILTVVEETLVNADTLEPGQLLVLAPEIGQGPSWSQGKLEDKRLKAIRLTLMAPEDIKQLAAGESPREVRRQRLVRLVRQAYEQGTTLSSNQLALMTGMHPDTINRQLREHMQATGEVLPTRGIIEDMGSATSHKKQIIARHLKGESTSEIARATNHTPMSVERYIRRFEQVRELVGRIGEDPVPAARILGCSQRLVVEYLKLLPKKQLSPEKEDG